MTFCIIEQCQLRLGEDGKPVSYSRRRFVATRWGWGTVVSTSPARHFPGVSANYKRMVGLMNRLCDPKHTYAIRVLTMEEATDASEE